jgi:hypothetical protein
MWNEFRNAGQLLNEIVVVGIALFFPVAMFMAIIGA